MVRAPHCFLLAAALLTAGGLAAQTVYKSVDEKGNVTYSENPPAAAKGGKMGSTTELPIDPNRNLMPAQQPASPAVLQERQRQQNEAADSQRSHADEIAAAQAALEAAEAATQGR